MTNKEQRAREAREALSELRGWPASIGSLNGSITALGSRQLDSIADRIAAALPDEQPAQGEVRERLAEAMWQGEQSSKDKLCDQPSYIAKRYYDCADTAFRLLAPSAGPAVEALVADMRERAAMVAELMITNMDGEKATGFYAGCDKIAQIIRALPTTAPTAGEG